MVVLALPGIVPDQAGGLGREVDAGDVPEPEAFGQAGVNLANAQSTETMLGANRQRLHIDVEVVVDLATILAPLTFRHADVVKEDVTRLDDRVVDVHGSVPGVAIPATVVVALGLVKVERHADTATAVKGRVGIDHTLAQPRE